MKLKFSKKAMFILIILMVLISLSTVSAAKTNSSDDMGRFQYDQSELENDLDSTELSDSSDENVLSSAYTFTGATFTELKENISSLNDGDVLDLTNNITQDGNAEITISKSITINGNGVTIDAQGKSRIFNITANNVILKDIIFTNGKTTDDGGAVFFLKDGEVTNCKFTNNTANYGGAVYFKPNSACNITNCNFTGNTATYDGGAVYFWDKCSISNCNFANNTASRDGGAVTSNDGSTGTVTNCTFTNNAASGDGGAVMLYGPFTVTNCNFTNNIASNNGGAVYFMAKSTAENCNFTNNTASNNGGAVYFLDDATVTKCNFTNNLAENGGAIFVFKYSTSTVSNCNFANNTASNNGGALSAFNNMDILNSVFNNNIADKTGGAVYIDDTLSDSKINSLSSITVLIKAEQYSLMVKLIITQSAVILKGIKLKELVEQSVSRQNPQATQSLLNSMPITQSMPAEEQYFTVMSVKTINLKVFSQPTLELLAEQSSFIINQTTTDSIVISDLM